ncbi:MAG: butyrate kinase [Oscillospiraceae bacterium]|nr:butyrate kinase [Oscillospiraceae bacterium]
MKVLVINPGATSTKVAVFEEEQELLKKSIVHTAQELEGFDRVIDQAEFRQRAVLEAVAEGGFRLEDFDAVCGRGGLYRPIPSGTYAVSDRVMQDVEQAPYGEHPSNLGAYLARRIGDLVGIPAFFVDPVCVDEMTEMAHVSGFAEFRRLSQFHALNQKSVGRKAARQLGKSYEEARLIVCHLGGGVSVAAHDHGRVVDVFNVKDEGAMGMDRGGGLPVNQLIDYCYAGRSREEVKRTLGRRSGMLSYVGTTDFREICARVVSGDERFTAAYRALVYQLAKDIGAMAAVLHFEVDAIVYTGGMAYEQFFCDDITAYVGRLAPVLRFPGEEEMRALAEGALRVLHGEAQAETY